MKCWPMAGDLTAVRAHAEHIHRLAAPLAGNGKLIVAGFGEDPNRVNPKTGKRGCPWRQW